MACVPELDGPLGGALRGPKVARDGWAECVLVTERPTPAPLNSTLTVIAEAESAGCSFGTTRGGGRPRPRLRAGGESARDAAASCEVPLPPGSPRSFEIGAIHDGALFPVASEAASAACAFDGFSAISLTFPATVGSRMTSLRVTRIWPSSVKTSLNNFNKLRRSRRVHVVVVFSSSRNARKCPRRAVTSFTMALTVVRERWLTSAPRRCCRLRRFVSVRASAWLSLLSSWVVRSMRWPMAVV